MRPQLLLLLALCALLRGAAPLPRSAVVKELLGPTVARQSAPAAPSPEQQLSQPDPFDEFAEPRRLDWPEAGGDRRRRRAAAAEKIRRRLLWRMSRHRGLTEALTGRAKPLPPHPRDSRLDQPDPYRELASEAYYRFVRAILSMRNRMVAMHGFDKSSAIGEFFEDQLPPGNATTSPSPTSGPEVTPSPPVCVCPPRWRLGDHQCQANATFCYKDSECPEDSRCCFDGCKLRCLEPELLVRHVCRDYTNSTVFPGDLYMAQREQICTCDELGRPEACKDKKPCIDIISSSLFKLPYISNETVKLKKPPRSTRQKIYDALQKAFKHVKTVY